MRRLAGREAYLRRLDAMVDGIAHQVHQRIADLLEHGLVELGGVTGQAQLDFLAEPLAEIAHQGGKRLNTKLMGNMRTRMTLSWRLRMCRQLSEGVAQRFGLVAFERRRARSAPTA